MQHNHAKLKKMLILTSRISLWCISIILLAVNWIFKSTIDFNSVSTAVGIVAAVLAVFIELIERVLWKTKIMNFPLLEDYWTPVLEGRWKGTLVRDNKSHDFVVEIKQSFTGISCITYSSNSSSSSIAAEILYYNQLKKYQMIYYWSGTTKNVQEGTGDTNRFNGITVLDIQIINNKAVCMNGEYFTDRQPGQTKGTINLCFEQKQLKNGF